MKTTTRKVKKILSELPPECPYCSAKGGSPTLCDMCLGVRELRNVLGVSSGNSAYTGRYNNGRWVAGGELEDVTT